MLPTVLEHCLSAPCCAERAGCLKSRTTLRRPACCQQCSNNANLPILRRARELLEESDDSEDLAAAEREQQAGQPPLEQRPSGEDGTLSEGHLDADVESEQEGATGPAAVRQRGAAAAAAAASSGAAAAAGRGLVGHPLPSVAGHPLPSVSGHPLASPAVQGHPLASPSAHPLGASPAAHPLASPPGHPLNGDLMSD